MSTHPARRTLATAAAGVAVAAAMAATADAATVEESTFSIRAGVADFGSGDHSFGDPSGPASYVDDISVVNGQMVVRKRSAGPCTGTRSIPAARA